MLGRPTDTGAAGASTVARPGAETGGMHRAVEGGPAAASVDHACSGMSTPGSNSSHWSSFEPCTAWYEATGADQDDLAVMAQLRGCMHGDGCVEDCVVDWEEGV